MKRPSQRRKPASDTAAALRLTPALVRSAKAIVSIYDRIDDRIGWKELHKADCDTVHLYFQSSRAVDLARRILLEMAAGESEIRETLLSRMEGVFRRMIPPAPPNPGDSKKDPRARLSDPKVESLLKDVSKAESANQFADLCFEGFRILSEITATGLETRAHEGDVSVADTPKSPPMPDTVPFWLGLSGDLWIGVPVRLALAQPIVGLCRRIARNNTGETTLYFKPGEEDSLRLHHRLWEECKPHSYRIPLDDFSHPVCHQLQTILDAFIPKVRAMVSACLNQDWATGPVGIETSPTKLRKAAQRHPTNPQSGLTPGDVFSAVNQVSSDSKKRPRSRRSKSRKTAPVKITISSLCIANVSPPPESTVGTGMQRALLGLAALAGDKTTEYHLKSTKDFVALTHPGTDDVPHDWGVNKDHLEDAGVRVEKIIQKRYSLTGFELEFLKHPVSGEKADKEKIMEALRGLN